jgi:DNA-binding CsgD family transcriptional regulator
MNDLVNKAIARDLFRRICEKLGMRNRTEAAVIAREAGAI